MYICEHIAEELNATTTTSTATTTRTTTTTTTTTTKTSLSTTDEFPYSGNAILHVGTKITSSFAFESFVELLSLDQDNPVPSCLRNLKAFPSPLFFYTVGAVLGKPDPCKNALL